MDELNVLDVTKISPAPLFCAISIHSIIFFPESSLPQSINALYFPSPIFFASIETIIVDDPNSFEAYLINFGFFIIIIRMIYQ